jgi:hypothetical protein
LSVLFLSILWLFVLQTWLSSIRKPDRPQQEEG